MTTTTMQVTEPGVYIMTAEEYHQDPVPGGSLSSSGARTLLPPSCPALFKFERDNPPAAKRVFEFGHAAHGALLGTGPRLVVLDFDDYKTRAAQEARDAARAVGAVPLLAREYAVVVAMGNALSRHPFAGRLFTAGRYTPEACLFWRDEPSGIMRRAMLDCLPDAGSGRMIIADYKTTVSADPAKIAKSIMDHGYYMQAPWYVDGVKALGLADDPLFVFVFQEKTAPYLVSVVQCDIKAMRIGQLNNRKAIDLYAQCAAKGHWPAYCDDVELVSLPFWFERQFEDQL